MGVTNISAHSDRLMGYATLNIDRLAMEGLHFLHPEPALREIRAKGEIGAALPIRKPAEQRPAQ